ncbi:hypothetical protein DMB66_57455 [Actinoplanes sp. ATCC 53533]|uniref:hypothetical protein n=1 Tax=Actinoplanes sp. ATCC 53533 TaxID=1288362 RepID=UPI000F766614|nr:hypothetical protein [Actinoplanes sp. ATCC 53533]RSM40146.1 hypothetical protein DMB66_57455 [Actinoplanes sp. ATCC 53533]
MESEIQRVGMIAGGLFLLVITVLIAISMRNSRGRRPSKDDSGSGGSTGADPNTHWDSGDGGGD